MALSKCDRVETGRVAEVGEEIQALLNGTVLAGCPVFPVSAVTGEGVGGLRSHLETMAAALGKKAVRGGFRLAVDRCFTVAGAGTVVTGTVFSGRVAVGERLMLSPSGRPVRVRGIHAQNRPADMGLAGQRCALNLAGVEKQQVQRGDWVLAAELNRPSTRLDVRLKLLASETQSLKHWTPVHLHLGAFHATGRVALLRDGPLAPGDSAWAQLVLDKPTCAVHGDRCILRDASALRTLAGGVVLDAQPPLRGRRTAQRLSVLSAWEQADPPAMLQALLQSSPDGVDLDAFAANANLGLSEMDGLCQNLRLRRLNAGRPTAFAPEQWMRLKLAVVETLLKEHNEAPDSLGLNPEQLRLRIAPRLERAAFAQVLAELLEAGQCARDGTWWHLPGHTLVLMEKDQTLWRRIAPLLLGQPFQPPRVRDIARAESLEEGAVRKLLIQAARMGFVYRVAHDHFFDREAVARLADIVRDLADEAPDGAVSAARFRDRMVVTIWLAGAGLAVTTCFQLSLGDVAWSAVRCGLIATGLAIAGVLLPRTLPELMREMGVDANHRRFGPKERGKENRHVVVYGAGDLGNLFLDYLKTSTPESLDGVRVVGFIDDTAELKGRILRGFPVLGTLEALERLAADHDLFGVVVAINEPDPQRIADLESRAARLGLVLYWWKAGMGREK